MQSSFLIFIAWTLRCKHYNTVNLSTKVYPSFSVPFHSLPKHLLNHNSSHFYYNLVPWKNTAIIHNYILKTEEFDSLCLRISSHNHYCWANIYDVRGRLKTVVVWNDKWIKKIEEFDSLHLRISFGDHYCWVNINGVTRELKTIVIWTDEYIERIEEFDSLHLRISFGDHYCGVNINGVTRELKTIDIYINELAVLNLSCEESDRKMKQTK